jgi:hypothetical protein
MNNAEGRELASIEYTAPGGARDDGLGHEVLTRGFFPRVAERPKDRSLG